MDPLTHTLLGASLGLACFGRRVGRATAVGVGGAAGAAPDLDVVIGSATDPLLAVEFHRHFTHALPFAPVGAAVVVGLLAIYRPWREQWRGQWVAVWAVALVAWVSHALLDAATSYGTLLLWPLTDRRYGWDFVAVVDPAVTVTLAIGLGLAWRRRSALWAGAGLALAAGYLGLGVVQHGRAVAAHAAVAAARGHVPERIEVMPTLGNVLVWRALYEGDGKIYADRVRVGLAGDASVRPGWALAHVREGDLTAAERARNERRSFARFTWFAEGWVARSPADATVLGDMRYSMSTEVFSPVWGIRFTAPGEAAEVAWVNRSRDRRVSPRELWEELMGRDPRFVAVADVARVGRSGP
jgi:inner membrane protein